MKINKAFAENIYHIREQALQSRSHSRNVVNWEEDHRLRSGKGRALVFILPTRGCSWALSKSGGCSICGYIYDNPQQTDFDMIIDSFNKIVKNKIKENIDYSVKIFTSGSFLDTREVPVEVQSKILGELANYKEIKEIVVESRPEFVTSQVLENISNVVDISLIEIAIGLESANNKILKNSINKGFFWEDFKKATERILEIGARVKAYLLFKPPFVSEYDSINDMLRSVDKIVNLGVDTISINAVSIHRGTYLSQLFESNQYRTPWLWSLLFLCKNIKKKYNETRLICDVVAGGNIRGAHNCGDCDKQIIQNLKDFTMSQNIADLERDTFCSCLFEWKSNLLHEKIGISEQFKQKVIT